MWRAIDDPRRMIEDDRQPMERGEPAPIPHARPEDALEAIGSASPGTPLVLDFDETLFLENSSEEYLDSVRPRTLARFALLVLGALQPWRIWPADAQRLVRDWFRVLLVTVLTPWSALRWRSLVGARAEVGTNARLAAVLAQRHDLETIVATHGFTFIVRPLLDSMPVRVDALLARRLWLGARDGVEGKARDVASRIGAERLAQSVVVTDSIRDRDLLEASGRPYLIEWPEVRYRKALEDVYLPLVYIEQVKHAGRQFLLKTVLADDWLLMVLAVAWTAGTPVATAIGLLLLSLGFWTIYEVGYRENDRVAAAFEAEPTLREEYFADRSEPSPVTPWVWTLGFTVAGSIALSFPAYAPDVIVRFALLWLAVLATLRLVFWSYNKIDKGSRAWLYLGLHVLRSLSVLVLLPASVVGVLALVAQVLSRWSMYLIYRLGRAAWPGPSVTQLTRLLMFIVLVVPMLAAVPDAIFTWQLAAITGWFAIRARRGLRAVISSAGPIS